MVVPDQSQHRLAGPQGLAGPIETDLAKQAMLNGIPLRTAGGIVTHREAQPHPVAQLALQLVFPKPRPMAVTAASIRQDQQAGGVRIGRVPVVVPPAQDRCHRELGRVGRHAHVDGAFVALHIIDAIGGDPAKRIRQKIMHVDGLGFLPPGLAGVFEVPQQLFFLAGLTLDLHICRKNTRQAMKYRGFTAIERKSCLGIDTDDGIARRHKVLFLGRNIPKLRVAIRVLRAWVFFFGIDAQRIIMRLQQATHGGGADAMPGLPQPLTQRAQATAYPLLLGHRIPGRFGLDQSEQSRFDQRIFFRRGAGPLPARVCAGRDAH